MALYKRAYFDGSISDIRNYVKINSQGYIKLSEIQRIYSNNNLRVINKLKGHLLCPRCKRAKLFYKRRNMNSNIGYLQKLPTSHHSKGCHLNKLNESRKHYFYKKYNNINNKNAKNLLEVGMYRAVYKNSHSRNQVNSSDGNNIQRLHNRKKNKEINKKIKRYKTSKYRFLKWNHRFNKYDNKCECILYGRVKSIKLLHKLEIMRNKKLVSYEKVLDINNEERNIYGLIGTIIKTKNIHNLIVFNGTICFSVLCYIKYSKHYKKHIYIDFLNHINQKPYKIEE